MCFILFEVKKFVVLTSLFVLSTNVWGMPEDRGNYGHIRRHSMLELGHLKSFYGGEIFCYKAYSDLKGSGASQSEEDTDSITFLNELIKGRATRTDKANTNVSASAPGKEGSDGINIDISLNELINNLIKLLDKIPTKKSSEKRSNISSNHVTTTNNQFEKDEKDSDQKMNQRQLSLSTEEKKFEDQRVDQEQEKQVQKKLRNKKFREKLPKFLRDIGTSLKKVISSVFKRWSSRTD